jgi:EAL domain-containing protein (putative c-di-GMP-specific phosphodiesterase class I)
MSNEKRKSRVTLYGGIQTKIVELVAQLVRIVHDVGAIALAEGVETSEDLRGHAL